MLKSLKVWGFSVMVSAVLVGCGSNQAQQLDPAPEPVPEPDQTTVVMDGELEAALGKFHPLGEMPIPEDNPMTDDKIELGEKLFFDSRLSGNNKQSCASCHSPGAGYGDNLPTFFGFEGFQGPRNSPTVINTGYYDTYFWDGRAGSLEEQALGPIQSEVEMNQNLDELVKELKAVPAYVDEFQQVFGEEITGDNIAKAIAAFERTIVIDDTRFDQFINGDMSALNEQEVEGMKLFVGKASCISCHAGPALTDQNFHNLGMEGDEGRFAVTNQEEDMGKFRTPALRGIAHTAPYMHDGSLATLHDVVDYYNQGGGAHTSKSPLVQPLGLDDKEVDAVVAFLEAMSGEIPMVETPQIP